MKKRNPFFVLGKKLTKPSAFAVLLLIGISVYSLFSEPLIGLADNGDFYRVMVSNDIMHEKDRDINDYFGYFNHEYDQMQYYNQLHNNYLTTQNIVVRAAVLADDLITRDDKFDIRFSAGLCLLVLALAIYLIVESASFMIKNPLMRYLSALLAVVMFADIGYISYFNSFYGEAVAYPFFLLSVGALLRFSTKKTVKIRYILLFFIGSFFFIGAKNQFAANGILAFGLLACMLFAGVARPTKVISVSLGVILLACTAFFYTTIDSNISLINQYHMITRGVMLYEPDPEKVTEEVGLDRQYSMLSGTIYFDSMPQIDPKSPLLYSDFYPRYNLLSVTAYYFEHSDAFNKILEMGLKNSYSIRTEVLGNYERSSGRQFGEKTDFFALWSTLKENYVPHTSGLVYMLLLVSVIFGINRIVISRRQKAQNEAVLFEITLIYVAATAFSQILVSLIGAGDTDLRKHLFITTVSFDILFYFAVVTVLSFIKRKKEQ